ncbi:cupin domain-containing protein [uncultured Hymenobacter sp.]|uniref:(R)-mandelonitrile lyase n=1 Tax=uncultured Hymenobacter sp. TaxID=170016 RepID=UPI0035CB99E8
MKHITLAAAAFALLIGLTNYIPAGQTTPAVAKAVPAQGPIFPKGTRVPAANFTGVAYLTPLVKDGPPYNCVMGSVSFEPGARSNWHTHPAGQILLITDGLGYYQEEGRPVRLLHKGDVIQAQPNVKHWHGASPKQAMTHISVSPNSDKGVVTWLQPVTDKEYNNYK